MQDVTPSYPWSRELSIQIGLDGFSFVIFDTSRGVSDQASILRSVAYRGVDVNYILEQEPMLTTIEPPLTRVFVGCSTDNVLLVPQLLFEPERGEQYLMAANMYMPGMTTLSNNLISQQAAAVWQVDTSLVEGLLQLYPGAMFYHPLLLELDITPDNNVHITFDGDVVHITVCHTGLYAAETLSVDTPEELLYYVQKLIKHDKFTNYRLVLTGEKVQKLQDFFERYFREVDVREVKFYNHQRIREVCV